MTATKTTIQTPVTVAQLQAMDTDTIQIACGNGDLVGAAPVSVTYLIHNVCDGDYAQFVDMVNR